MFNRHAHNFSAMVGPDFTWTEFYTEFADKLVVHKNNRKPLMDAIHKAWKITDDQFKNGTRGPLRDIDPFTTIGMFNRQMTDANRQKYAGELKKFLGVKSSVPNGFDGIPLVHNMNTWFFSFSKNRKKGNIDAFWNLFYHACRYADNDNKPNRAKFAAAFDNASNYEIGTNKITMGLFWIRPYKFLPLDKKTRIILEEQNHDIPEKLNGEEYLTIIDRVSTLLESKKIRARTFPELSWQAYDGTDTSEKYSNYAIVTDSKEIAECQRTLTDALSAVGKKTDVNMGWQKGNNDNAYFIKKYNILWKYEKYDYGHWNMFGVADDNKSKQGNRRLVCQFSIPVQTTNESQGTCRFAKDANDRYHILHSGQITRNKKTIDRHSFSWPKTVTCDNKEQMLLVSALDDKNLIKNLSRFVNEVQRITVEGDVGPPQPSPSSLPEEKPYTIDNIIDEGCFLERSKLEKMIKTLQVKKNIILQGPPGTGKTWLAKRLGFALMGAESRDEMRTLQFHPNMSYEDFVRGWRPSSGSSSQSDTADSGRLELVDGPLLKAIQDAKDNCERKFVIVIEEINRGNPANIFGEMLTLLEADKRTEKEALMLSYSRKGDERVYVPDNLYIIGTMNVADRAIALVDLALRRRFGFFNLKPEFNKIWKEWVKECGVPANILDTIKGNLESLNDAISNDTLLGPHYMIGHSYVTPSSDAEIKNAKEWFEDIVRSEIGPLLEEYWITEPNRAHNETKKLLKDLD